MIITFGNQKGGVGKTTLAIAFSNYVKLFKDKNISVLDFDFQKSFFRQYQEDINLGGIPLYEVENIDDDNFHYTQDPSVLEAMKLSDDIYIFDTAGNITQEYTQVLIHSDYIIIPFRYSSTDMRSTIYFLSYIKNYLNVDSKVLFVMNNMRKDINVQFKIVMDEEFKKVGTVIQNPIRYSKSLLNVKTTKLDYEQKTILKDCFEELIFNIWES